VDEMPVVSVAIYGTVLAHGRDDDAVGEGEAALRERCEEAVGRGGHGRLDVVEEVKALWRGCVVWNWAPSNRM